MMGERNTPAGATAGAASNGAYPTERILTSPQPAVKPPADSARDLLRRGYAVIPVPYRYKKPIIDEWEKLRITEADLPEYFNGTPQNIGTLNGAPSKNNVDSDLDWPEARRLAPFILPKTGAKWGRLTNPLSHWRYVVDPMVTTARFTDPEMRDDEDGARICELLSTGTQSVAPGSTHKETGEAIEWQEDGEPAIEHGQVLLGAMRRLSAASMLARRWKKDIRHDLSNALAGALLRAEWPEDEVLDFIGAIAEVANDEETRGRLRNVVTTAGCLAADKPATGIPTIKNLIGDSATSKICEWLGLRNLRAVGTESPEPMPWPAPLPPAAFYGLAGDVVRAIEPNTEADPAALLLTFLCYFGNAVGRNAYAVVESDRHHLNLNPVLVGETAKGRKGTGRGRIAELFNRVDPTWEASHVVSGLSSGEGLIWAVRDKIEKLEADREKGKPTGRYTSVVADPGIEDKRLLVFEGEFAGLLAVMEREGSTLSPLIRLAWDTGNLRSLTKNSPARATDAHISIIGHVTKDELLRYLNDTQAGNGFANRFLWACTRRSRILPEGGGPTECSTLVPRLRQALDAARNLGEMKRDDEARAIWREVYPILSDGKPGLLGAVTARAEAQVLRLSALYAAIDGSRLIRREHLIAALAVWGYCEESAKYIFGDATGDPVADRIITALRQCNDGLDRTSLSGLFARNISVGRLDKALAMLLSANRVRNERVQAGEAGRPREVWYAI